ncbi:MAG: hypothetical protein ACRDOD_18690, partial [Streptosporangiaceae bacterium]
MEPDLNPRAAGSAETAGPGETTGPADTAAPPETGGPSGPCALLRTAAHGSVRWETGLLLLVIAIVIFGAVTSSQFLTSGNFFNTGVT